MRVIYENNGYRIVEKVDLLSNMDDLKGDMFDPKVNKNESEDELRQYEIEFEEQVSREGVYGYILEKWNPEIDGGWEHVDSCWGIVGQYSETSGSVDHDLVNELKDQIPREAENAKLAHS